MVGVTSATEQTNDDEDETSLFDSQHRRFLRDDTRRTQRVDARSRFAHSHVLASIADANRAAMPSLHSHCPLMFGEDHLPHALAPSLEQSIERRSVAHSAVLAILYDGSLEESSVLRQAPSRPR
jgi:hypothetical protein